MPHLALIWISIHPGQSTNSIHTDNDIDTSTEQDISTSASLRSSERARSPVFDIFLDRAAVLSRHVDYLRHCTGRNHRGTISRLIFNASLSSTNDRFIPSRMLASRSVKVKRWRDAFVNIADIHFCSEMGIQAKIQGIAKEIKDQGGQ